MKKKKFFIFFLIFFIFLSLPAKDYALQEAGEELKLYLGQTEFISVSNPTRIVIGNPNVVDVTGVSKSEITLAPKAAGATTFVFWDDFGENAYRVKVFAENMNEVKRRADNLLEKLNLPGVYTKAEDEEAKVFLLGRVKSSQERERVNLALGSLKDKITDLIEVKEEEAIVDIDVNVLELDKGATSTLGFTWPGSITLTEKGSQAISTDGTTWGGLFRVAKESRDAFSLKLDTLIQEGKARILSRPRLTCQSGKEAELLVGGEKPTFTTSVAASTGSTGTNVEYKEYGIKLKIKPTVTEEKRVKVALNIEVSELESSTAEFLGSATSPTAKAYPLTKRNTSTEVFLDDGQTLAISGLIKQKTAEELRKFPWLADIPVLGVFFRKRTVTQGGGYDTKADTELFITLTPKIIGAKKTMAKSSAKGTAEPLSILAASEANLLEALVGYSKVIQKRILEHLIYPKSAKDASFQGTVKLGLHLSYRGELLDAVIKSSSGYKTLDEDAVAAARGIRFYPPFPSSIEQEDLWVDVPVSYKLD